MKHLITAAAFVALMWPAAAAAQDASFPPDDPDYRTELLGSWPLTPGATCVLETANNVSVHPGNKLYFTWDSRSAVQSRYVEDVEAVAGESISETFEAGDAESLTAWVLVSLDVDFPVTSLTVSVSCDDPPPPTTTTPPPPDTTTTSHPDTGGREPYVVLLGAAGLFGLAAVLVRGGRA